MTESEGVQWVSVAEVASIWEVSLMTAYRRLYKLNREYGGLLISRPPGWGTKRNKIMVNVRVLCQKKDEVFALISKVNDLEKRVSALEGK